SVSDEMRASAQGGVDALSNLCGATAAFAAGPLLAVSSFPTLAVLAMLTLVPLSLLTARRGRLQPAGRGGDDDRELLGRRRGRGRAGRTGSGDDTAGCRPGRAGSGGTGANRRARAFLAGARWDRRSRCHLVLGQRAAHPRVLRAVGTGYLRAVPRRRCTRGGAGTGRAAQLSAGLANTLPTGSLRLNSPVTAVTVTDRAGQVDTQAGSTRADQVILALPPAVAVAQSAFTPALPGGLQTLALQTPVRMGNMVKAVATYD